MISLEILGWNPAFPRVFTDEIDHIFKEQKKKTNLQPSKQTPESEGNLISTQYLLFFFVCFFLSFLSLYAAIHLIAE